MKNKLGILLIIAVVVGATVLLLTNGRNDSAANRSGSQNALRVTASFFPMEEFVRQIGGDKVEIITLVTPGVEPHDFEPSPRDLVKLRDSALFVYNGAGLEPWAEKISSDLAKEDVRIVNASEGITLLPVAPDESVDADELFDPHVWLDPVLAQTQVTKIAKALTDADPANAAHYRQNAERFSAELAELDASYKTGLAQCERRTIVTSHEAFSYLAQRYDIDIKAIAGLAPDEEPSPQTLSEVAEFAKQNNIRYIFFETLASPKLSQTIAREIGAKTSVLNPLEGLTEAEAASDANYISVQRENLSNLRLAMGCS